MHRLRPSNLRAAWWAIRTARRTRRVLRQRGLDAAIAPPPPPPLPAEAGQGVRGALRRWHETCLVNSIVVQAWEAAHGRRRDLVIGITSSTDFRAHAWLQGDPLPGLADDGVDMSLLNASHLHHAGTASADATGNDAIDSDSGLEPAFKELLRRPAPEYASAGRTRIR